MNNTVLMPQNADTEVLEQAKRNAQIALKQAEKAYHNYASLCEIGDEREMAFMIFENIRNAGKVY